MEELVADVLIRVIDPFVYQEALDLIALHRALGRRVYIVSSSPEEVVRPLAAHFDITDVIATRAEVVDGAYTGELAFYCYGDGKADVLWQNDDGSAGVWLMDGTNVVSATNVGDNPGTAWHIDWT